MAQSGKVYPEAEEFTTAPTCPGSHYNVKEQHLPAPVTYSRGRRGRSGCCCFLTWFCSILWVCFVLLCFSSFIFWLVVRPIAPKFDLESVRISGLNTSSSPINTNVSYTIMARNPNKRISFHYDDINLNVEAYGVTIGDGSIAPFHQGHTNTTLLSGDIFSEGIALDSDTLALLRVDPTVVPLYAVVDVKARFKVGSVMSSKITIKGRCNLNVDLTRPSGSQITYKVCWVDWHRRW